MITLYDNPFSPFARKVRMVLHVKGIEFQSIDALALHERERLLAVNPRAEVPVLVDGALVVVSSADIAAYLEDGFPKPALLPASAELRAKARHWQGIADTVLDAVIHATSRSGPGPRTGAPTRRPPGCSRPGVANSRRSSYRSSARSTTRASCAANHPSQTWPCFRTSRR